MNQPEGPWAAVSFELSADEWADAALPLVYASPVHRTARRNWVGFFVGLYALVAFVSVSQGGGAATALMMLVAALTFVALTPTLYRWVLRRQLFKIVSGDAVRGLVGPHRIELWPDGVLDVTPASEALWRWPSLGGLTESPDAFVIRLGTLEFLPIPKTAFRDADMARHFGDAFFSAFPGDGADEVGDLNLPEVSSFQRAQGRHGGGLEPGNEKAPTRS